MDISRNTTHLVLFYMVLSLNAMIITSCYMKKVPKTTLSLLQSITIAQTNLMHTTKYYFLLLNVILPPLPQVSPGWTLSTGHLVTMTSQFCKFSSFSSASFTFCVSLYSIKMSFCSPILYSIIQRLHLYCYIQSTNITLYPEQKHHIIEQ